MPSMLRGPLVCGLIAILMLFSSTDAYAGSVRIVRGTDAGAQSATLAQQTFMRDRYWRMRAFAPVGWFSDAWSYQHAFGLDPADAAAHPTWRLLDNTGTPVYVGTRVAADVGNASFRAWWIARAQASLAAGYRGLFIDDVFMERRFTTAAGVARTPIDPRTGAAMTEANWQKQMADFMVAVRGALPAGVEIVHDVLWYKGDAGDVLRELQSASYVSLDKGYNDTTVVSGTSTYGWQTLNGWVDREQARGVAVIFDASVTAPAAQLYGLASYLLVTNGASAIANDAATAPGGLWAGYDVDLGAPTSARYATANVWRRDFAGGFVLVNEPYRTTRTITVPAGYQDLDGVPRTSVTLAAGTGAVLVPTPPPAPTPTPTPVVTPEPTAPPAPVAPAPPVPVAPSKPSSSSSSSGKAHISTVGHTAGARAPGATRTSVGGSRARLYGKVTGAVAGSVRLTVERKRGSRWVVVRRVSVTVKRSGTFSKDIPRLPNGAYRVRGSFLGTGTSLPSRSAYRGF